MRARHTSTTAFPPAARRTACQTQPAATIPSMRVPALLVLLTLTGAHAQATPNTAVDPAALGSELARLGGAAFDRGYLTLAVTRLNATAELADALARHADTPALRQLGQQQAKAARMSATLAQNALRAAGGPDLSIADAARRGIGGFTSGLLGRNDANKSDVDLYERLLGARAQLLATATLAVTRAKDPAVLNAARDLLKLEADAYTALRLADPR